MNRSVTIEVEEIDNGYLVECGGRVIYCATRHGVLSELEHLVEWIGQPHCEKPRCTGPIPEKHRA